MFLLVGRFEWAVYYILSDVERFTVWIVLPRVILRPHFKLPLWKKKIEYAGKSE